MSLVRDADYSGRYFAEITYGSSADCCYFSWDVSVEGGSIHLIPTAKTPCTICGGNLGSSHLMGANIFHGNSGMLCNLFKIYLSNFHNFTK